MSSIDERIVRMRFDNKQFEAGIKQTLDSLSQLQKGLDIKNVSKSFDEVSRSAGKLSLEPISQSLDSVSAKFSAMSTLAVTALATIGNKVTNLALTMGQQFTTGPIKQGLEEYETNLNSIQTILSNTRSKGTNLDQVNAALQELNTYSDKTIYNFGEMARNIGTFTAAGVDLETSVGAIKGIANLAAVSGSNSQQAATAMYQLSQALSTGTVKLMDWNSVVNAGMGGQVFQDALKETARAHGVAIDSIIAKEGSFRDSLQTGWLSSQILTDTLAKFTGDLTADQLKSMGYTQDQIAGILAMGKDAQDAATKVKTFSQLMGTLQEASGSGWQQTWQIIFGDFEEARTLFTGVNNVLGGFIGASADARNKVLSDWKALGGRTSLINSIANAFNALISVLKPIKEAFSEIFPAATGADLAHFTKKFEEFTSRLKISSDTADKLKRTFKGFFAIFDIGKTVVIEIYNVLSKFFGGINTGNLDILEITASIGDFLVYWNEWLKENWNLVDSLDGLFGKLAPVGAFLSGLGLMIQDVIVQLGLMKPSVDDFGKSFSPIGALGAFLSGVFSTALDAIIGFAKGIFGAQDDVSSGVSTIVEHIKSLFSGLSLDGLLQLLNTGIFASIVLIIKKFVTGLEELSPAGMIESITGAFDSLTGTLDQMQNTLRAATLLQIAIAMGILTASLVALSKLDGDALNRALIGLGALFAELFLAMMAFEKGLAGISGMGTVAASLILLAIGIRILSGAVIKLAEVDAESLGRGLFAIGTLLAELALFTRLVSVDAGGVLAGTGLILLATAIRILVKAVQEFAKSSWEDLKKGLTVVAAILAAFAAFSLAAGNPATLLASGVALLVMSGAMTVLARALGTFAKMQWEDISRGLGAMAAVLGAVGLTLSLIPPSSIAAAVGLAIAANSLIVLAGVLKLFSTMKSEEIARGLVALGGSLLVIAAGLLLMNGTIGGSVALAVAAASIALLVPALKGLGELSLWEIIKAIIALAAAFVVIGVAALVLTPIIPSILALGLAVAALGAGMALVGLGVFLFAAGLTAIAAAGSAAGVAISVLVTTLLALVPQVVKTLAQALIEFIKLIANSTVELATALGKILGALLKLIIDHMPQIAETVITVISGILDTLQTLVPKMIRVAIDIVFAFIRALADKSQDIVHAGLDLIAGYLNGIADGLPGVIDAAFNVVIAFIDGLADSIRTNGPRLREAGVNLADSILDGLTSGLGDGVNRVKDAATAVASGALDAAKSFLDINSPSRKFIELGKSSNEGMAVGLTNYASMVKKPAESIGKTAILALSKSISGIPDILDSNLNVNPVITPVLDLTNVTAQGKKIDSILGTKPLDVTATATSAKDAATGYTNNKAQADVNAANAGTNLEFIQYNTSPKALSPAEIYRNTKNQLTAVKEALT